MLIILSFPFFVCLGAVVGSLLTTALHRFHRGEDLIARGFHCHGCGKRLGLGSLIPIISFLRQRGKCLDCGEKINPEYFIMELVNAVVYGLLSILFGFGAISFYMSLLFSLLLMIGLVDIRNQEVPVYLQLSLCIFVLLKVLFSPIDPLYAVACAAAYFAL
ncbi:MAG: prepilin peptidase, partial [Rickettsiales bacterium]|nr:prepilin peptidase [Rickettsiales bacterium]